MYVSGKVEIPHTCPRCKVVLPPGEVTCYSCGLQLQQMQAKDIPRLDQSSLASGTQNKQTRRSIKGIVLYFVSIALVIFFFAFLFIRAAGISLSAFIPFMNATPSTIAYPVPEVPPLFSDTFLKNENGWNLQSTPGIYTVTVGNGNLTMEIAQHKLLWEPLPGERSFSNFVLTANAELTRGDQNNGYGVYIRGTANQASDLATYYRFELYGDGSYAIFKGVLDATGRSSSITMVDYTVSPSIQAYGKLNHLMIIARGASLSLIVNDHLLKTISDQSYSSGTIALFVSNLPQAKPVTQVQFSHLAIYPLQG